jgi:hypothetical protein
MMKKPGLSEIQMFRDMVGASTAQLEWADEDEKISVNAAEEFTKEINRLYRYIDNVKRALYVVSNTKAINERIEFLNSKQKSGGLNELETLELIDKESKIFIDTSIRRNSIRGVPRAEDGIKEKLDLTCAFLISRLNSPKKNIKIIKYILLSIDKTFHTALMQHESVTRKLHDSWILSAQALNTPAHNAVRSFFNTNMQGEIRDALAATKAGSKEEKILNNKLEEMNKTVEYIKGII